MTNKLFIVWTAKYTTKIPILDEQHRCLVGVVNSLYYLMAKNMASEVIMVTLTLLEQYAQIHFLTEESLLEQTGYPDARVHKNMHDKFLNQIRSLILQSRNSLDAGDVLQFMKTWLNDHVLGIDQIFVPHVLDVLQKRGDL